MGYLDAARLNLSQRGSLDPFNAEAISESSDANTGLPGFVLQQLHLAVEHAIREGWPSIDAARIRQLATSESVASDGSSSSGSLAPPDVDLRAGQGE
jgi:hypothetical protein